jgi:hypothetical protein
MLTKDRRGGAGKAGRRHCACGCGKSRAGMAWLLPDEAKEYPLRTWHHAAHDACGSVGGGCDSRRLPGDQTVNARPPRGLPG